MSCVSTRKATSVERYERMGTSTRDTVREKVVVEVYDTLREVTTITVQQNEAGDTVKLVQVTDRTRASVQAAVKDKEVKVIVQTDTVVVEKRDRVSTTNGTNLTNGPSGFVQTLRWIFWIIVAVIALTITLTITKTIKNWRI